MNSPVVLIIGALTGIGRAAALAFAREGAHLVVAGRRDKEGQELAAELQGLGAEAIFVQTDVRNEIDDGKMIPWAKGWRCGQPGCWLISKKYQRLRASLGRASASSFTNLQARRGPCLESVAVDSGSTPTNALTSRISKARRS